VYQDVVDPLLIVWHRCRSKQILGGAKDFFQTFFFVVRPPKKWSSLVFLQILGANFWSQTTLGAISPRFSGILPRYLRILFGFSGILPKFSEFLPTFSGILPGFSTNQNFWGCACTPASYTTGLTSLIIFGSEKERSPEQFVAIRDK